MFNTSINIYAICIIVSLIVYFIVAIIVLKTYETKLDDIFTSIVFEFLFIIFGALLLTYINGILQYKKIIIGLSSSGGAIGAIFAIYFYCILFKKEISRYLITYIIPLPLAYGVAKLGCFFAGCCYGVYYNGIFSVTYNYSQSAPIGVSLLPIQLIETMINTGIFIYLIYCFHRASNQYKKLIGKCFILTSFFKFVTDYFRMSHINKYIFSLNQYICLIFLIIGCFLVHNKKQQINKKI